MFWRKRKSREQDLERELRSDLELETTEQQESGLSADEAHYAAQRAFGNKTLVKEDVRRTWNWTSAERIQQDLRYATRTLRRSPGFTFAAVLALALGIGANTAIFSVVNSVILHPLPFRDPTRVMMLDEKWLPRFPHFEATPRDFLSWREQSRAFEGIAAFVGVAFNLTDGDRPERISGARVSANLPAILGVTPVLKFYAGGGCGGKRSRGAIGLPSLATAFRRRSGRGRQGDKAERYRLHDCRGHATHVPIPSRCRNLEADGIHPN